MNIHGNARLTPVRREEMALAVISGQLSKAGSARLYGVSAKIVRRWTARYRTEGPTEMQDRSSRPKVTPIFIDETWINTNMTRTCGWATKGKRLTAHVPHGHWKTLTFLAGLRHDRIVAPFVLDGPNNADAFTAWVSQCLTPTLAPGDIVIADSLGSHKGLPARQMIPNAGAHLLFLPPYSPDLNPIEINRAFIRTNGIHALMSAKLKTLFRKADERTVETSWRRVGNLLDAFTPAECQNYFRHAGYPRHLRWPETVGPQDTHRATGGRLR